MKKEELTSREIRRRRRIRSQIAAYVTLAVMIILVIAGIFLGVKAVMKGMAAYDDKVSEALAEAESNVTEDVQSEAVQTQESVSEETAVPVQSETAALDELVNALLQEMTLEEKVAGMFIVSPESITGVGKVVQAGE